MRGEQHREHEHHDHASLMTAPATRVAAQIQFTTSQQS
jgi:hypothetical protein